MTFRQFLFRFLPLWLIFLFLKGLFSSISPLWFMDIPTALALALLLICKVNFWAFVAMALLGLSRSFDGSYPLFFFTLYYSSLLGIRTLGKRYLKEQSSFFPYLFWGLAISVLVIMEVFLFFHRLTLYSLTYTFWFNLLVKSLLYALLTFLFTIFSHWLLKQIWDYDA